MSSQLVAVVSVVAGGTAVLATAINNTWLALQARRQPYRTEISKRRIESYERLWALTKDLDAIHPNEPVTRDDQLRIARDLYDW